ncbi:hypothetical protein ACFLYG_00235 [Chloroflexota bacterium]
MGKVKIVLVGPRGYNGGCVRLRAVTDFLVSENYQVKVYHYNDVPIKSRLVYTAQQIFGNTTLDERVVAELEDKIKKEVPDVIIAIGYMDIVLRDFDCLKIFFCEAPATDENYFALAHRSTAKGYDLEYIKELREREINAFNKADYVVFPWECYEEYVRRYVYENDNLLTIRFGCTPQQNAVSFFFPPSIVYLGALGRYWNNMELLSHLSSITPNVIDVYGSPDPARKYNLRYKGIAPTLDVLNNYQFGLNTVSKDILRQNAFSSKILDYLSYGLPCLFPEWQRFPHELKGCVSYNEDNFVEVLEKYSEKSEWQKLSQEAIEQARELSWDKTLQPLLKLIESR